MYHLAYNLETKEFLGCRFDPTPKDGEGIIDVESDSEVGLALKNGETITINEDLTINHTPNPVEPTAEDTFKATIKAKGVDNINASDALEWTKIEMKKRGYE